MLALATWRWRLLLERPGRPRAAAAPVGLVPGRDLLQQLPAQQHRRRRRARARQLAAHRLDRPPRSPSSASTASSASAPSTLLAAAGLRARRAASCASSPARASCSSASALALRCLAYIFFRPGTRARLHGRLAARARIPWAARAVRDRAGRRARLPLAARHRLCWRCAASLALQTLVVFYYFAIARGLAHPAPGRAPPS